MREIGNTVGALMVRTGFWGFLMMIIVELTPKNPILIIKAPNIEPYHRSLIEPVKDPLKGALF